MAFNIKIQKIGTSQTQIVTQADVAHFLALKEWEIIETILVPETVVSTSARSLTESGAKPPVKNYKKSGCGCGK